ncbi:nitroreductase [Methanococcus maripaludis C5]|uniref:Nitroreductase n=1 Tax=Methanococcus maripaludis (strain C5 / ATCC BAA-1333) TaxID=402880 RepID=A4FZ75_METM5|nr:nitroreductase family protein [Methanococcus maripaludis]ABO35509.1 nitroreductase [Methanococcus maripaludis C5]
MNQVLETIKNRRSVRKFKKDQIKDSEIEAIIEAAIYAPTALNEQPWHFTVIQNKNLLDEINTVSKKTLAENPTSMKNLPESLINAMGNPKYNIIYEAPTLIIVSGNKNAHSAIVDCSAAIQNMLLAAESMNIGSIWLGLVRPYFTTENVKKLNIPEDFEPYYGIAFGYKLMETPKSAPERRKDVINYVK